MTGSALLIARQEDILSLTLNLPAQGNALSPDLVEALIEVFEGSVQARCVTIRGAGRHFCTGFYLADLADLSDGDILWRILRIEHLLQLVNHCPVPVTAFAQGQSVGAGVDLFAACTFRIASPEAKFRMPGWNFGLALGTRRLTALIGPDAARDILIDTKVVAAEEARETSFATQVAPQSEWDDVARDLAARAVVLSKTALANMLDLTQADTRAADLAAIVRTAGRPGLRMRIAAYRDKMAAAKQQKEAS